MCLSYEFIIMSRGRSYNCEDWWDYQEGPHTFVEEDFVHDKAVVLEGNIQKEGNGLSLH